MTWLDVIKAGNANTVDEEKEIFGCALVGTLRILVPEWHGEKFIEPFAVWQRQADQRACRFFLCKDDRKL